MIYELASWLLTPVITRCPPKEMGLFEVIIVFGVSPFLLIYKAGWFVVKKLEAVNNKIRFKQNELGAKKDE